MSQTPQYDDGVRRCPQCHQDTHFQLSGIYYHCEYCSRELSMKEFDDMRDPRKRPIMGVPSQTPLAVPRQQPRVDKGRPPPDAHPLTEWGAIPDGVPDGDPKDWVR